MSGHSKWANIKNKKAVEMPTIETKQVVNTPNNQS